MHIIATFEYSTSLELALSELENTGIPKKKITAFPLDKRVEPGKLFDSMHQSDGISLFDLAAVFGAIFMLLGTIYGYVLKLGPILWGLFGLIFGLLLGFLIDYTIYKRKLGKKIKQNKKEKISEVVIIIECKDHELEKTEKILWSHAALGLCKVSTPRNSGSSFRI
ncbi:hypothetical protein BKP35_00975 [Anaerobacillus arseniciselenatis]|uniref:Uncharacterized protein n=1 Tax=Anaerobacillus arseniciselenatis TaxID=85682 RepID=A0A1S2LVB4_9BACI|nr:hypothetical protein [Anaerobacillus arseniciselenatis]OIJ15597.1 hypothetical protein BKP35_00975 [Anaerobacillus arseniciselenatis]